MSVQSSLSSKLDPPESISLRVAFVVFWAIDAIAATLFFLVPYATELNPVTVFFYHVFGLPGVILAAACYAAVIVGIGHVLSDPLDVSFVALMAILYLFLATNNVLLLLIGDPLPEFLGM